jgi:orotidine-5'-phosphate decarboxylase
MLNVHALGGPRMLSAAREALGTTGRRPLLIGVTILTSHSAQELADIGLNGEPESQVLRLARMGRDAGLDGVVCSAQEAARLRVDLGKDFCLVTPGIRPSGFAADDQRRVMTPMQAVQAGADYLVIGRPITQAPDPLEVLAGINRELATR